MCYCKPKDLGKPRNVWTLISKTLIYTARTGRLLRQSFLEQVLLYRAHQAHTHTLSISVFESVSGSNWHIH